jgi:hypothetical protein
MSDLGKKHERWVRLIDERGKQSGNIKELEDWASSRCEPGQTYVPGYHKNNGIHVSGYCKKI